MEALTVGSLGLKYKLVSVDNEFVTHFPNMSIRTGATIVTADNSSIPEFVRTATTGEDKTKEFVVQVQPSAGTPNVDVQLIDSSFRIEVNSIFFSIDGETPDVIYSDNIAVYELGQSPSSGFTSSAKFSLTVKQMTDTTFGVYSVSGGNYISAYVKVTGINSGLTKTFELKIS
jgi:hypothetical protein